MSPTHVASLVPQTMSYVHNSLLRAAAGAKYSIRTRISSIPNICFRPAVSTGSVGVQLYFMPLVIGVMFPLFAHDMVHEKEEKLVHMMRVQGTHMAAYFFGQWAYGMLLFNSISGAMMGAAYALRLKTWCVVAASSFFALLRSHLTPPPLPLRMNASPGLFISIFVGWAHSMVGMSFLAAALVPGRRQTFVLSFLVLLVSTIGGNILSSTMKVYPTYALALPPFAFPHAFRLALSFGGEVEWGSELALAIVLMYVAGTVFCALGMYLYMVLPSKVSLPSLGRGKSRFSRARRRRPH